MAEPIAALIVRILADTSEMVLGVKKTTEQLDTLENRVQKFGKVLAGYFTAQAVTAFAKEIIADVNQIDTAAKRLGASTDEFQRFSYAVEQSGGDIESAIPAITALTDKLASGDTGLFNVLRKLNINLDEFKAKGAMERFVALATAINGVSDPTQQLQLRLEALGTKGEAALKAVNDEFKRLADEAPVYTEESIQAIKRMEDGFERLWKSVKVGAAESAIALKDFLDPTMGSYIDADGNMKFTRHSGDVKDLTNPSANRNLPDALGFGGVDPNNAAALALAYSDLNLQATQAAASQRELKEQWDSSIAVLKMLKIEAPSAMEAIGRLMDKMDTSTKVDHMAGRILKLAERITELRVEGERLMEAINPGSTSLAGDDVDAEIFNLRSDSRNWQDGNLTAQALEIEHRLINNFNLKQLAGALTPTSAPSLGGGSLNPGGFASVVNPANVTINAQGSFLNNPDSLNQLARIVSDAIAKREGVGTTYSRR